MHDWAKRRLLIASALLALSLLSCAERVHIGPSDISAPEPVPAPSTTPVGAVLRAGPGQIYPTIAAGIAAMSSGDTLIIVNGTYHEQIAAVPNGSGPDRYTTIKAETDGGVVLTKSFLLDQARSYISFEGLKFDTTENKQVLGNHIRFMRCAFKGGQAGGNNGNVTVGTNDYNNTQYILFEDSWMYGAGGRYKLCIYNSDKVVLRRVVVRDDGGWTSDNSDPEAGITVYQSSNVSIQNALVIDSDLGTYDNDNVGAFYLTGHAGNRSSSNIEYLGSMSINNKSWGWSIDTDDGGIGLSLRDVIVYAQEAGGLATSNTSMDLTIQRGTFGNIGGRGIGNWGTKSITVSDSVFWNLGNSSANGNTNVTYSSTFNPSDLTGTGITHYNPLTSGLLYLPRAESGGPLNTAGQSSGEAGAQVLHQIGVSGTQWGEPDYNATQPALLWPWPHESRIRDDFATVSSRGFAADPGAYPITKYIWEILGQAINPASFNFAKN